MFFFVFVFVLFLANNFHVVLGQGLDRFKDSFNYWLSHSWQCVEHSFGMLTQNWGVDALRGRGYGER